MQKNQENLDVRSASGSASIESPEVTIESCGNSSRTRTGELLAKLHQPSSPHSQLVESIAVLSGSCPVATSGSLAGYEPIGQTQVPHINPCQINTTPPLAPQSLPPSAAQSSHRAVMPHSDKNRKMLPLFAMFTRYFPRALREVTKVCVANNVRFSPDREPADISWNRGKSPDQLGSLFRHIFERVVDGKVFEETTPEVLKTTGISRMYVLAEAAWRALAALELEVEANE